MTPICGAQPDASPLELVGAGSGRSSQTYRSLPIPETRNSPVSPRLCPYFDCIHPARPLRLVGAKHRLEHYRFCCPASPPEGKLFTWTNEMRRKGMEMNGCRPLQPKGNQTREKAVLFTVIMNVNLLSLPTACPATFYYQSNSRRSGRQWTAGLTEPVALYGLRHNR